MSLSASSRSHYLAVFSLLNQLDPKEYNWKGLSVVLQGHLPIVPPPDRSLDPFGGTKLNIQFNQIVSNFLMDRDRAGSWVNPQTYVNLATRFLKIMRDKCVYNS